MANLPRDFAEAAWRIGSTRGQPALTVRALAKELGVSVGLLYVHFEDKAALMGAVRRLAAERLAMTLDAGVETGLAVLCARYVAFVHEHLWVYESEEVALGSRVDLPHRDVFIARARRSSEIGDSEQASKLAAHLWMAMHSLAMLTRHETTARADELIRDHIALWLRAVAVEDVTAPRKAIADTA